MTPERFPSRIGVTLAEGGGWWMEIPDEASPGWTVTARIVEQGDSYAVAEVRIHPNRTRLLSRRDSTPGQWEPRDPVPQGGLTARQFHDVRLGRVMAIWRRWLEMTRAQPPFPIELTRQPLDVSGEIGRQLHPRPLLDLPTEKPTPGPGRPRRTDAAFLPLAEDYALLAAESDPHIIKTLADHYGTSVPHVSTLVQEARRRGLLSQPPNPGAAAGELTAKARHLRSQLDALPARLGTRP